MSRQLQHVVSATILGCARAKFCRKLARIGLPSFSIAGAAGAVRPLADDFIPEVLSDLAITDIAREFKCPCSSDHLWDMRVYV